LPEREFRAVVQRGAAAGIATVVHAIGDAAVTRAFDVLSAAPRVPALPHRVEHVQCLPFDRAGLLGQGIICSVQPCHLMTDWRAADRHWGRRGAATYAFRTMLENGAVLACGSDAPVESADPRLGLFAAVARRDIQHQPDGGWYPEQAISIADVLAGYTSGAAITAGAARTQGVLQAGAYADFVAWKTDPLLCRAADLLELEVAATIVDGGVVWQGQRS
jgi:predicted amidohydrolase YtcJ